MGDIIFGWLKIPFYYSSRHLMDALKRIHEVQVEMSDTKKWAELSQETQQIKLRNLSQDECQYRSYLTLARETIDIYHYLTQDINKPFFNM